MLRWPRNSILALAVCGLAAACLGAAGPDADLGQQGSAESLPRGSRDAQRRLSAARRAIDHQRYADAMEQIHPLLAGDVDDGFIPLADDPAAHTTVRREARRLYGALGTDVLEGCELRFGPEAQSLVEQAVLRHDRPALVRLADGWFFTQAGRDAAMLLAYDGLDRGQPHEAIGWLRRLGETPEAAGPYEPQYSVLLAICRTMLGQPQQAREALARIGRRQPQARFRIGTSEFVAGRDEAEALTSLEKLARPKRGRLKSAGDAARSDRHEWNGRPGELAWIAKTVERRADVERLKLLDQQARDGQFARLPVPCPLVVGDLVLARTASRMVAIDFSSGRQIWEYPWDRPKSSDQSAPVSGWVGSIGHTPVSGPDRIFADVPYGQITSDGCRAFLLEDLDPKEGPRPVVLRRGMIVALDGTAGSAAWHRLVALDLAKEGSIAWSVGAESGEDEPRLASAFFLAPPMPDGPWLFVIAELKDELTLCQLRAADGRLEWSQVLARPNLPIARDSLRRLAGARPAMADGILVCPTAAGAAVAVDRTTRSLLWAYAYPRSESSAGDMRRGMLAPAIVNPRSAAGRWADTGAMIADGRVLLTPADSDLLYCLDLQTGREQWSAGRGESLFAACIDQGKVVLVGPREVTALRLADRRPAWPAPIKLPDGAMPSGRGLSCGGLYYLPTTAREILALDLAAGRIAAQVRLDGVPGNLISVRGRLLSQSPEDVRAFEPKP